MASTLAVGEAIGPISVPSVERYVPTGLQLARDAAYVIQADNSIWVDWHLPSDANGREATFFQSLAAWALRCKRAKWFQLIGAVGKGDDFLIPIGKHLRWTFDGNGCGPAPYELFLFANDAYFAYYNNKGTIGVTITRVA
jgi:hypothetical protein